MPNILKTVEVENCFMAGSLNVSELTIDCSKPCLQQTWNKKSGHNRRGPVGKDEATPENFRLFEEWVYEATGILSIFCESTVPYIENINPDKHSFSIDVEFDFNQTTFRPTRPAQVVTKPADMQFSVTTQTNRVPVWHGTVKYKHYQLVLPFVRDYSNNGRFHGGSIEKENSYAAHIEHHIFSSIRLTSPIFKQWALLERENRHKSYEHLMNNWVFSMFVAHAFRFPCGKASHNPWENALVLAVTFSFTLGQIESVDKYFVVSINEMIDSLKRWYQPSSKTMKQLGKRCQARKNSRLISVPVVLLSYTSRKVFVHHLPLRLLEMPAAFLSLEKCDKKAAIMFAQIQKKVKLPLSSPPLE